ncbi:MAG: histidinol-phosphate aminotransferase [Peptococcaceae bacterium BRH_c8a]|nr:MAG: histidinol-phosphate aminotransferase [Peptococcaceae bacterium BRH_c8a]
MSSSFNAEIFVREEIKGLTPYNPDVYPECVKLDANENPYPFPKDIQERICRALGTETFTRYPDAMAGKLVHEICTCYGLDPNQVMLGNGSDELIQNLMLTFGAGNRVVIAVPTFSMYGIHARVAGAEIVEVPRDRNFDLVVNEIVQAGSGAGLVVICSPNNPSGNSATTEQLIAILEGCCHCPVVVDQAYLEFGGTDMQPLLAEYDNLVILRTFSKAFGLAGLRVGYLFANPGLLNFLFKVKQPFNLNNFSQAAAREVLRNRDLFAWQVAQITGAKEKLYQALQDMPGIQVYPSDTNYLLFATSAPANEVYKGLLQEKVLIRNFGDPLLARYLRVTVGTPEENKIFLRALRKVIDTLGEKKND